MATLDEVISQMSEEDYLSDPIQFIIDSDLRIVSVPDRGVVAGVVGDKNVNRINFQMPRYYNGFDMSKFKTRINYVNAKGNPNYYTVTDLTIDGDLLIFSWLVDADVVAHVGTVAFSVNMVLTGDDGITKQAFNTSNVEKLKALEGIQVDKHISYEEQVDLISKLEADLTKYISSGINQIQDEGAKVKKSLPADYVKMTEDVASLKEDLGGIIDKSVNILNPKNITYGRLYIYKEVNGKYIIDSSPREEYACAFVDVKENNKYIISGVSHNCFGTSDDGEILSYCSRIDIGDKDTPNAIIEPSYRTSAWTAEGVVTRVYFSWRKSVFDNVMVAKGEVLPQAYVPFKKELMSDIDIDISQIKNLQESPLAITVNDVASKMKEMTELTKEIVLPTIFNNSYIDVNTKKVASFSDWCVRSINLNKGDKLTATINGTDCCLATCIDKAPTLSSKFDIIFKTNTQNGYKFEFVAEKDETIYLSTQKTSGNTGILTTVNVVNINSINEKVDVLSKKMDKNTEMGKLASVGYSLDYNKALETIEAFNYIGDNPWTKLENADDFESFGTYIDNKIESIPNGNSFIFITDVHYTGNQKRSGALIDYIRRRANIKTIIHGGDVQNERPLAIDAAKDWFDFNKDYVGRIGSDFKQVCGDHDHNGQFWGKEELRKQYNLTDASKTFFTCNFVQKVLTVLTGYCENEIVYDTVYDDSVKGYGWNEDDIREYNAFKKMHYYFDDEKAKTRFIVLFTGWSWSEYGFPYNKCGVGGALPTQMDFLYNALMTVNDKYNVIVLGHDTIISSYKETVGEKQYYDTGETVYNSRAWKCVSDMLSAMKMKTSTTVKYSDWSKPYERFDSFPSKVYDFTNSPNVNVCMTIGGDVHWDILSKTTTDDSETIKTLHSGDYINISTDIPHIVTMTDGSDRGYCDYTTRETICKPATKGTIDEQAFDIVTINNDGIFFTRIGSGNDRSLLFASN